MGMTQIPSVETHYGNSKHYTTHLFEMISILAGLRRQVITEIAKN